MTPRQVLVGNWFAQNWKTIFGLTVAGLTAWFSLKAQVAGKAEKVDVDLLRVEVLDVRGEIQHLHGDVEDLISLECRGDSTFACRRHNLP